MSRTNLDIPDQLAARLKKVIPWGMRNNISIALFEELARVLEYGGRLAYVDIVEGDFKITCTGLCTDSVRELKNDNPN